jgi:hypothetical protein
MHVVLFVLIGIIISIYVHMYNENTLTGCVMSSIITSLVYQVIGVIIVGYMDPFAVLALIIGAGFAFVISMIVKIVMSLIMKKSPNNGEN